MASDVANAIIDGTDAVMLSGESAVGDYPVESVKILASIATDIEPEIAFVNYPPRNRNKAHALAEALNAIDEVIELQCIVAFTETGHGDQVLVLGGIPMKKARTTSYLNIHTIGEF